MASIYFRPTIGMLALGILLGSCTFNPTEIPLTEVKPVDQPKVSISLTELGAKDTLYVFEPTTLTYNLSGSGLNFRDVTITYDSEIISTSAPASGTITISTYRLTTGIHKLRIQFYTNSGSGSLADKAGQEAFVVWREVIIVVDVDLPPVVTPQVSTEGGYLKLSWPAYRKANFVQYVLVVEDWYHPRETLTLSNHQDTAYVSSTFFGGQQLRFWLEVVNKAGSSSCPTQVIYPQYTVSGTYNPADSTVSLTWSSIQYPGAFLKTVVMENNAAIQEFSNPGTTSLTFRPARVVFGYGLNYSLVMYGKDGTQVYASGSLNITNPIPSPTAQFPGSYFYQAAHGPYLGLFGTALQRINDQWQTTQSWGQVTLPLAVPPLGDHYYTTDGGQKIFQTSLVDQSIVTHDILRVSSWGIMFIYGVSQASADGKVVIRYQAHNSAGSFLVNHVSIVDLAARQNVFHAESSGFLSVPVISGDGRYFFYGNQVYEISGTNKTLLYTLGSTLSPSSFRPDQNAEFFALSGGSISVVEAATGNILRVLSAPETGYGFRGYDAPSKHLLFLKNNAFYQYAVHVETGAVTRVDAYHGTNSSIDLRYGYIINQRGEYFKAIDP